MKGLLAGLIVAMVPLATLTGQGISVSAIIPTQSLLQRASAPVVLARQVAPAAVADVQPSVACDMPVAAPNAAGATEGGISLLQNHAVPMPVARSGCANRMARQAPDSDLLKKQ